MSAAPMPDHRPARPFFSSGPCAKRPGWSLAALEGALLGRSHRSAPGRAALAEIIDRSKSLLGIPEGWRVGIVPASDTGAVELALWSLLSDRRGIDVLAFESFTRAWAQDLVEELAPANLRILEAPYGALPDLTAVDWSNDVVFAWNGTTSGVRMPNADWIAQDRTGLAICDATSAAFAMHLPWDRLDVVTWSWQKVLGGEAAHGMIALSPRAADRLTEQPRPRGLPKIFRLTDAKGRLIEGIFNGDTINTPSMLCAEDALDGLRWAERIGGLPALIARSEANLAAVAAWVDRSDWAAFLAADPATHSPTSICLTIAGRFASLTDEARRGLATRAARDLDTRKIAFDVAAYRDAPPGFRLWGGATVETADIEAVLPWLDWAVQTAASA